MIPKIIHYCWFSYPPNSDYPPEVKKCIDSWKKYMPDYEIKLWNTSNFDLSVCPYAMEAYQERKFAFASDYVRLWVLHNGEGVYFDTDVEVLRNFDTLLDNEAFTGCENNGIVAAGVLGSEKGNPIFKELLDYYNGKHFILGRGFYNTTPIPELMTKTLIKYGLTSDDKIQRLAHIAVYPMEYFYPFNPYREVGDRFTENTYTNHHYSGSWLKSSNEKEKQFKKDEESYKNTFGKIIGYFLVSMKYGGIKAVPYIIKRYIDGLKYLIRKLRKKTH